MTKVEWDCLFERLVNSSKQENEWFQELAMPRESCSLGKIETVPHEK